MKKQLAVGAVFALLTGCAHPRIPPPRQFNAYALADEDALVLGADASFVSVHRRRMLRVAHADIDEQRDRDDGGQVVVEPLLTAD